MGSFIKIFNARCMRGKSVRRDTTQYLVKISDHSSRNRVVWIDYGYNGWCMIHAD